MILRIIVLLTVSFLYAAHSFAACTTPSRKVHAFYFHWFRGTNQNTEWMIPLNGHGTSANDLATRYYPVRGPYSNAFSGDANIIDQHMAELQCMGVGVVIVDYWNTLNQSVPTILNKAAKYNLKVSWLLEPHQGRTVTTIKDTMKYLIDTYGNRPDQVLWKVSRPTRYGPRTSPRPVFYIWASSGNTGYPDLTNSAWKAMLDGLRSSSTYDSIVLADQSNAARIDAAHFDGIYNWGPNNDNLWKTTMRNIANSVRNKNSIYVGTVAPGFDRTARDPNFTADKISYRSSRSNLNSHVSATCPPGVACYLTYNDRWNKVVQSSSEWAAVISYNDWTESHFIEPAKYNPPSRPSFPYFNFTNTYSPGCGTGSASQNCYINRTRNWGVQFRNSR